MGINTDMNATRVAMIERRQRIVKLKLAGFSNHTIARTLGINHETVRLDLHRAMREWASDIGPEADMLRSLQAQRLHALIARLWPLANPGDAKKQPDFDAVEQVRKLMADLSSMYGVDRPPEADSGVLREAASLGEALAAEIMKFVPESERARALEAARLVIEQRVDLSGVRLLPAGVDDDEAAAAVPETDATSGVSPDSTDSLDLPA